MKLDEIKIEDYNYNLPESRIAKYPLAQRDRCKLLLSKNGQYSTYAFYDLPKLLPQGTLLVCNNTKVIKARLMFSKPTGGGIEIFCLEPIDDYQIAFAKTNSCTWKCMVGGSRKWKQGKVEAKCTIDGNEYYLYAQRLEQNGNTQIIKFEWESGFTFAKMLEAFGQLPIPPYLNRKTEASDLNDYQTVYSKIKGSVAAPTAGLHFTDEVLLNLQKAGIEKTELTLHVGAGTFQPVKTELVAEHTMHTEFIEVELETLCKIRQNISNIIAVGTTSVRTLESLYYLGCQVLNGCVPDKVLQWDPYHHESKYTATEALDALIAYLKDNHHESLRAETQIIIVPGYDFKIVKGIITNFHQPKSTLLLLLAAFVGDDWKNMYDYALKNDYRFLSYGDSSLLLKE